MDCPIDIIHSGVVLSPLSLFTLLTALTTNLTSPHLLTFRHDQHEFSIDFKPSLSVLSEEEKMGRTPMPFCHFHGANNYGVRAWLSVCSEDQIDMILRTPIESYAMENNGTQFFLVSPDNPSCDLFDRFITKRATEKEGPFDQYLPAYYDKFPHLFARRRYVEFAMFGDYALFEKYGKDEKRTMDRMKSVLNMANSFYDSLNIEILLVHSKVWTDKTEGNIDYTDNTTVLETFRKHRESIVKQHYFDNANLLMGAALDQTIVGKAYTATICHGEYSTSWVLDMDNTAAQVGSVLAHELGHNIGLGHDLEGNETSLCKCPMNACIMNSGTYFNIQHWSNCSLAQLDTIYRRGEDKCLWNIPETKKKDYCGNGIIEEGEDCDCGEFGCVTHKCCDHLTCTFSPAAKCAHGSCCDLRTCTIHQVTRMCREQLNTCDLPEFCDGESIDCPADIHLADGLSCPDETESLCFDGICASRKKACVKIWGDQSNAKNVSDFCYTYNKNSVAFVKSEEEYLLDRQCSCKQPSCKCGHPLCGKLYCSHTNYTAVPIWPNLRHWNGECFAVLSNNPHVNYGHAPNGASCGDGKVCLNTECVPKSELLRDSIGCNDCARGVCNSLGLCHCTDGLEGNLCLSLGHCDIAKAYDPEQCDSWQMCEMPDKISFTCLPGFELEFTSVEVPSPQWRKVDSMKCESQRGFKMAINGLVTHEVARKYRCKKEKGCDFSYYFDASLDCDISKEKCTMPVLSGSDAVTCPNEMGIQVKITETSQWTDVELFTCNSNILSFVQSGSTFIHPLRVRCVMLRTDRLFDASECKNSELCYKPTGFSTLKCPVGSGLRFKIAGSPDFTAAQSINCATDKCRIDGILPSGILEKIQCATLKCTSCQDPCPVCSDFTFTSSSSWNSCSHFKCNKNLTVIRSSTGYIVRERTKVPTFECHPENEKGESRWRTELDDEIFVNGTVECRDELLCTVESPLVSKCDPEDYLCDQISLNDNDEIGCSHQMIHVSANDRKLTEGSDLTCNKKSGTWQITKKIDSSKMELKTGDNVFCKQKEFSAEFCTTCVKDEVTKNVWRCPPTFDVKSRNSSADVWSLLDYTVFICRKGKWENENGMVFHDSAQIMCYQPSSDSSAQVTSTGSVAAYSILIIVIIIIMIILILYIFCRIKHNKWLHTIVIRKIKGQENDVKLKNKSASSSKTQGGESNTQKATEKDVGSNSRKAPNVVDIKAEKPIENA